MMKIVLFFFVFLLSPSFLLSSPSKSLNKGQISVSSIPTIQRSRTQVIVSNSDENEPLPVLPNVDHCYYCVDFMSDAVNDLLNGIANGLLGTCGDLCSYLGDPILEFPCIFFCEYEGLNEFIDVINVTDPDPIYICQELDMCPEVDGGEVTINSAIVNPSSGPTGTQFNVTFKYTVVKPTGPGTLLIVVIPPEDDNFDFPFEFGEFNDPQPVGVYEVSGTIDTTPVEMEVFAPGLWTANVVVCEGDCDTVHPYGGIYAQANATFTITNTTALFFHP